MAFSPILLVPVRLPGPPVVFLIIYLWSMELEVVAFESLRSLHPQHEVVVIQVSHLLCITDEHRGSRKKKLVYWLKSTVFWVDFWIMLVSCRQ